MQLSHALHTLTYSIVDSYVGSGRHTFQDIIYCQQSDTMSCFLHDVTIKEHKNFTVISGGIPIHKCGMHMCTEKHLLALFISGKDSLNGMGTWLLKKSRAHTCTIAQLLPFFSSPHISSSQRGYTNATNVGTVVPTT